ncbi:MAG: GNAT family N-acetyltransferase [Clostridia bacterium]|nr:GNAT family N-acetyltransferase [Clostridia bacterium]
MKIYQVKDKKKYIPLLLLADEQESMIEKYVQDSVMYVLDDGGIKGEITVLKISDDILEIKNLAVYPQFQRKGYGKALIDFVCNKFKDTYSILQVGTGDSPLTIPFYEKCGFVKSHTVKNFFVDNYDHPIIENGVILVDMIYLKKSLYI